MINLKELYNNNVNIMQYLRDCINSKENNSTTILASYDMQAGSYIKVIEDNNTSAYWYKGQKHFLTIKEFQKIRYDFLAEKFKSYIYMTAQPYLKPEQAKQPHYPLLCKNSLLI